MIKNVIFIVMTTVTGLNGFQFKPDNFDSVHYVETRNFGPALSDQFQFQQEPAIHSISRQYFRRYPKVLDKRLKESKLKDRTPHDDTIKFVDLDKDTKREGSFCRREHDQAYGYCLLAHQCRHIFREFKRYGTKIDICAYDKTTPIVCCTQELQASRKPILKKRISAKKCEEYSQIGVVQGSYMALVVDPVIFQTRTMSGCNTGIPLIVGGENAYPGEFPHMAAVGWTKRDGRIKWSCAGSLISENFIITAAHCSQITGVVPDVVRLGVQNLYASTDGANPEDINIDRIILHPNYRQTSYYYDIGLIRLDRNVVFSKFIRPGCLWQSEDLNFSKVVATGWGRLEFQGRKAEELQKVILNVIDRTTCNRTYAKEAKMNFGIMSNQLCAGYLEGGKDTCQGDSGGPIQVMLGDDICTHHIVGITSFGKFCAAPNSPGVYTKVYSYLDWIEEIVFGVLPT